MTINNDDEDLMNARAYRRARMAESTEEQIATALGVWCMIHGAYDCAEPSCWRCGNHTMDDQERCSDPRCRSTNTQEVRDLVMVAPDAPIELLSYLIGRMLSRAGGRDGTGPGDGVLSSPASSPLED